MPSPWPDRLPVMILSARTAQADMLRAFEAGADDFLLVLDEPTVGLDPVLRAELWGTFRELAQAGSTLLISSHVMDEASECDVLLLMREGALLEQITPAGLRERTGEQDLGRAFLAIIGQAAR